MGYTEVNNIHRQKCNYILNVITIDDIQHLADVVESKFGRCYFQSVSKDKQQFLWCILIIFQEAEPPVHWDDFGVGTPWKMSHSLGRSPPTDLGSGVRQSHGF